MNPIYMDHNATTPLRPEVLEAMMPHLTGGFGNASSLHVFGRDSRPVGTGQCSSSSGQPLERLVRSDHDLHGFAIVPGGRERCASGGSTRQRVLRRDLAGCVAPPDGHVAVDTFDPFTIVACGQAGRPVCDRGDACEYENPYA